MKSTTLFLGRTIPAICLCLLFTFCHPLTAQKTTAKDYPRIVNIVNFIRLLEPRDPKITEDVLYQTVVKQVEMMRKYKLGGSFLLQYDALIDPRYQKLLKGLSRDSFEIGAWWELPQPLIEKAGLKWRGRYPWDWRADVGFSTGYTPAEREKIADVYMNDFKKIFGYYPQSVASWFIDAHTLNYLYNKYHIVASANCKDQLGTDGYTLWGGYWNQAYYPSKINSYMPAQNEQNQLPVPIFRMLGSDPVRQYDSHGDGSNGQGVVTLEPVYKFGGGDSAWVHWFFKTFTDGPAMEFAYTQAGQENSFTWDAMEKGFQLQLPLIAQLRDAHKVKVETLGASGKWFKEHYKTTPATAVTVNEDINGSNRKTVWFNSRYYRTNLYWQDGMMRIRDIHLFNENFPSSYTTEKATSNECSFFTLPFVDGYQWSKGETISGLRLKAVVDGKEIQIVGGNPVVNDASPGKLHIEWPLQSIKGVLIIDLDEKTLQMHLDSKEQVNWFWDLNAAQGTSLPFTKVDAQKINCSFEQMNYMVNLIRGVFTSANETIFRVMPVQNNIQFNFSGK
ncbi:MAG: hypothetical protein QM726_19305 [Chitinophagaceae bacterium]